MIVLGIHGDPFNPRRTVFESNAAVVVDGKLVAAVSEERLSREKLDGRFPFRAIEEVLGLAGLAAGDVDAVAFAGKRPAAAIAAYVRSTWSTLLDTGVMVVNPAKSLRLLAGLAGGRSAPDGKGVPAFRPAVPPVFYDHHLCHAAGAFYASPFDEALVVTLDGGGDGLDGSVYRAEGTALHRLGTVPHFQSPGTMYSAITHDLGFTRHRHEGKITGLAAYGKPAAEAMGLAGLIRYDTGRHRFVSPAVARHHRDLNTPSRYFTPLLKTHSREDVSATVQHLFEGVITDFVTDAYHRSRRNGSVNLCLAGGCFANVRLNQKLLELPFVDNAFVFPAMGDGGLGAGAALHHHYLAGRPDRKERAAGTMYLGRTFSEEDMEQALRAAGLPFRKPPSAEEETARLLSEGKVVGRYNGAMEYGPRALGNRSILAAPFDATINDWLNKKLRRTEFMPFAPSMTAEAAADYLQGYRDCHVAADFMTITYAIRPGMEPKIPAVVHVDHTARPQVVRQGDNPSYHAIIKRFGEHTGVPVVLNTSFNIHEEPIVNAPQDAIRGFLQAGLDALAMGPFIAGQPATG